MITSPPPRTITAPHVTIIFLLFLGAESPWLFELFHFIAIPFIVGFGARRVRRWQLLVTTAGLRPIADGDPLRSAAAQSTGHQLRKSALPCLALEEGVLECGWFQLPRPPVYCAQNTRAEQSLELRIFAKLHLYLQLLLISLQKTNRISIEINRVHSALSEDANTVISKSFPTSWTLAQQLETLVVVRITIFYSWDLVAYCPELVAYCPELIKFVLFPFFPFVLFFNS